MLIATSREPLRRYIRSLWQMEVGASDGEMPGWIAPDGQVEIVFHTGSPTTMRAFGSPGWSAQPQAFVMPMRRGSVRLAASGGNCIVALRVDPVVATVLLGRPMGELWDAATPLRDLIGSQADGLVDALAAAGPVSRFAIVERWMLRRLKDWTGELDDVRAIHARLFWRGDGTPLARVASHLGLSARSMRRLTADAAGLSPKELELTGRILRSCALLREAPDLALAGIALEVGFHDQAAFSHAFSRQVGMPPSIFRALPLVHYEKECG